MKKILFLLVAIFAGNIVRSQTFTVTNTADLNTAGCLRYELAQAIAYANTHSVAVELRLNASGYCQVQSALPQIIISGTSATLKIRKDPGAGANSQGVFVTNTSSSFNLFEVVNTTIEVYFEDLHLEGNVSGSNVTSKLIYANASESVFVLGCALSKAKDLVYTDQVRELSVQSSTLGIVPSSNASLSYTGVTYIRDVSIDAVFAVGGCNFSANTNQTTTAVYLSGASSGQGNGVKLNYNVISNFTKGFDLDFIPDLSDPSSSIQIYNNNLTCKEKCLYFKGYDRYVHEFHDNVFHCPKVDVHFVGIGGVPRQRFYIVESNPYGYTTFNTGNVFSTNNDGTTPQIICEGNNYYQLVLIGITLSGKIQIDGTVHPANHVWFQACRVIKNNQSQNLDKPIELSNGGNLGIDKPSIVSKSVTSNTLTVAYTYPVASTTGLTFDVDFYKSNASGDLIDYLGTQTLTSVSAGSYTANITVPSGISLTNTDRIATTITWAGSASAVPFYNFPTSAVASLGTSEAGYSDATNCIQSSTANLNSSYNTSQSTLFASSTPDPNWDVYRVSTASPPFVQSSASIHPTVMVNGSVFSNTFTNSEWLTVTDPGLASSQYLLFTRQFNKSSNTLNTLDLQLRANEDAKVYLNGNLVYETCNLTNTCTATYYSYNEPAPATISLPNSSLVSGQNLLQVLLITPTGSPTTPAFDAAVTLNTCLINADPIACENCIGSFQPEPEKKYLINAWVREEGADGTATVFDDPEIYIDFTLSGGGSSTVGPIAAPTDAKCQIIDGWQQIEKDFTVPSNATDMNIRLQCNSGNCLYDDIRVIPYDGSMKSYVYDPVNLRLVAELDERNFATFYEYDEEGKLLRVKKETERGIMTIKETRDKTVKK